MSHSPRLESNCHDSKCVCGRPRSPVRQQPPPPPAPKERLPTLDPSLVEPWKTIAHAKIKLQYLTMLRDRDALDLEPTQEALNKCENDYKREGVWCAPANPHPLETGSVPVGQAILNEMLDDCYDLIARLQDNSSEEKHKNNA